MGCLADVISKRCPRLGSRQKMSTFVSQETSWDTKNIYLVHHETSWDTRKNLPCRPRDNLDIFSFEFIYIFCLTLSTSNCEVHKVLRLAWREDKGAYA